MSERKFKDQFVIALIEDFEHADVVLSHAHFMAQMLQKGLILLHVSDDPTAAEPRLAALSPHYMALKGNLRDAINGLPDRMGAVLFVVQQRKGLLKDFAECKVAYLTVQERLDSQYKRVSLSVDHKKESKEKYVWASYFARFNQSLVTAHHYRYRDEGLRYKCGANLKFLEKLYSGLGITHGVQELPRGGAYVDCTILKEVSEIDLLVAVTTQEKDFFEYFTGTQEDRTLRNARHLPVLYLNPRDDIYVLCD